MMGVALLLSILSSMGADCEGDAGCKGSSGGVESGVGRYTNSGEAAALPAVSSDCAVPFVERLLLACCAASNCFVAAVLFAYTIAAFTCAVSQRLHSVCSLLRCSCVSTLASVACRSHTSFTVKCSDRAARCSKKSASEMELASSNCAYRWMSCGSMKSTSACCIS